MIETWQNRFSEKYVEMASGFFSDNVVTSEGKLGKSEPAKKKREKQNISARADILDILKHTLYPNISRGIDITF